VVWISNQTKLEGLGIDPIVPMTLDDAGCYTDVMPTRFLGLDVIRTSGKKRGQDGKANPEVLKALVECGNLLARDSPRHAAMVYLYVQRRIARESPQSD